MKTVSFQGVQLSGGQRRRLALSQLVHPAAYAIPVCPQSFNDRFPVFVGPYPQRPDVDHDFETQKYWRMANNFERYGRLISEESFKGTPFCGDRTITMQECV